MVVVETGKLEDPYPVGVRRPFSTPNDCHQARCGFWITRASRQTGSVFYETWSVPNFILSLQMNVNIQRTYIALSK